MTIEDLQAYSKELSLFLNQHIPTLKKAKARRVTIQIIEEQRKIKNYIEKIEKNKF